MPVWTQFKFRSRSERSRQAAANYRPAACAPRTCARLARVVSYAALVSVLCALDGCDWFHGPQAPATPVQTIHPKRGEIVRRITLPGNVMAYQEATLYAKVAGYLKTISVDKGDTVKEGDLLAEIEAPEMLADLVKAKAEAEAAQLDYKRVTEAQKKASDLVMPQTVDAAKAKSGVAVAGVQRIETLLSYANITAPFSGVITKRWVDPGALIPAAISSSAAKSAAVVTLMDFSTVRIDVAIPDMEAPLVKRDLPAKVTISELPGRTFDGTITRFSYALDESTKTMTTEIDISNPDLVLRPGMWASVEIELQKKENALLISAEALITEKNKNSVFVVRDNKAQKVPVATGFDDGVNVEILKGCGSNDAVIVAGKQSVTDGQRVQATASK
jgi:RND family efflux transporter MFP subunit